MLDLEPGVHLQEEEALALGVVEELDGAGADVPDRLGGPARGGVHRGDDLGVDVGRGRLLDDLLVATLDRAVALAEDEHAAVPVADDLDLDVPAVLEVRLDEDGAVAERGRGLRLGLRDLVGQRRRGSVRRACRGRHRRRTP